MHAVVCTLLFAWICTHVNTLVCACASALLSSKDDTCLHSLPSLPCTACPLLFLCPRAPCVRVSRKRDRERGSETERGREAEREAGGERERGRGRERERQRGPVTQGDGVSQGKVKPCSSAESCTARDVTAGVNVIAGGAGSATCIVKCPQSNLMCQASTVVFISPSDCQDVQVSCLRPPRHVRPAVCVRYAYQFACMRRCGTTRQFVWLAKPGEECGVLLGVTRVHKGLHS